MRCKLIHIPDNILLDVLDGKITLSNRPEGATVDAVHYNERSGSTIVRLVCPDFEDVLPGLEIPTFVAMWEENHEIQ